MRNSFHYNRFTCRDVFSIPGSTGESTPIILWSFCLIKNILCRLAIRSIDVSALPRLLIFVPIELRFLGTMSTRAAADLYNQHLS